MLWRIVEQKLLVWAPRSKKKQQMKSPWSTTRCKQKIDLSVDFVYDKQFIILMRCIVTIMPCTSVTLTLQSLNSINKCTRHIHKCVPRCTMYYMRYIYQFICGRISCQKLKPLIFDDCCCRWDAQIKCKMHIAFPWRVFMPLSFGTYGFFGCGLFWRSYPFCVLLRVHTAYTCIWLPQCEWMRRKQSETALVTRVWLHQDIGRQFLIPKNSIFDGGAHNIFN